MLKRILQTLLILLVSFAAYSQTTDNSNTAAKPSGGLNQLALAYYKIKFTKEQRQHLSGVELEFIYNVDAKGNPTLEEVHGVTDAAILDSLKRTTTLLPKFQPKIVNGVPEDDILFMKLSYPQYNPSAGLKTFLWGYYKDYKLEDYEYIQKSGSRIDMLISGAGNGFAGSARDYLTAGGGMKLDLLVTGKSGYGGGLVMSFYGNKLKKPYPFLDNSREQNSAPPTLLLGITTNKFISQQERRQFNLQVELCYAIQNVTPKLNEHDKGWTQLSGFSLGLVAHYLIKLGKDKPSTYYGSPIVLNNYLNIHGALRPVFFNQKQASGLMWEFGLGYRMGMHGVSEYKLKPGALEPKE